MASLTKTDAERFFLKVVDGVERGERILLAAFNDSKLIGTVQIVMATYPNQPHRADVAKLLVLRSARGQGVGGQLMERAEGASRVAGRTLLVLDTCTGDAAERLYLRMGWNKVGIIPKYALYPDGRWCDTAVFWKQLA
jgi:GNAT superfamily N-acetyltransferase